MNHKNNSTDIETIDIPSKSLKFASFVIIILFLWGSLYIIFRQIIVIGGLNLVSFAVGLVMLVMVKFLLTVFIYSIKVDKENNELLFGRLFGSVRVKISDLKSWGFEAYFINTSYTTGSSKGKAANFTATLQNGEKFKYPILSEKSKKYLYERFTQFISKAPTEDVDYPKYVYARQLNLVKSVIML